MTSHETKESSQKPAAQKTKPAAHKPSPAPAVSHTGGQRVREGVVLSNKMQKTLIVQVSGLMEHPQFKKIITRRVKYAVHDEKNEAKIGDKVQIIETRPLSKTKRWRLVKVLAK